MEQFRTGERKKILFTGGTAGIEWERARNIENGNSKELASPQEVGGLLSAAEAAGIRRDRALLESIDLEGFSYPEGRREDLFYVRDLLVASEILPCPAKVYEYAWQRRSGLRYAKLLEMLADDDDDDIWDSENFIATVEVFLQKAEHESAVKHGTQSVVPTAASNFPGTSRSAFISGPTSNFGPTTVETKLSYAGPDIRANENAARAAILQPLNYQNPWTLLDGRDVYSSQQSKGVGYESRSNLQSAVLESDNPAVKDILAEKDGAISLLRSRLKEAEQQVDELRRRVNSQTSLQPPISQQRELERLSSQLLFKEHEVNEIQRVRLEKEEQLKEVQAEAASLRRELDSLKQSRSTGAGGSKRPRDENASPQETSGPPASTEICARNWERQHDPWRSPWLPERTVNGTPRKTSQGEQERHATELPGSRLKASDSSPAVATLKKRTAENGCVSSKSETTQREKSKAVELSKRETSAQTKQTEAAAGMSELSYSLQQIWGLRGANDGKVLVAKIYADCAQDLYVLLSNGENRKTVDSKKIERRKSETLTLAEKFHGAIAKVTSGSGHPEIMLGPLLEFCNMENTKLLGCALRILHCILQHDENCRQRLVGRKKQSFHLQGALQAFPHSDTNITIQETKRGFKFVSKKLADGVYQQVPVFSSPRILLCSKGEETSEIGGTSKEHASAGLREPGISVTAEQQQPQEVQQMEVGSRGNMRCPGGTSESKVTPEGGEDPTSGRLRSLDEQQSLSRQQADKDDVAGGPAAWDDEVHPFLKWMLHLALTSTSPLVRLEAVAVIGVFVVHSEPLVERLTFGSLLNHEGFGTLLRESAGVEIQLQAVRIVHHILHCPTLYRKFCSSITEEQTAVPFSKQVVSEDTRMVVDPLGVVDGIHPANTASQPVEAPLIEETCISGSITNTVKSKMLAGLTECLNFTGTSLQGYALRRNVMRLITFIASCGDDGVAFLTQPVTVFKSGPDESTRANKDDTKGDGMPLAESASGQHIAGDGSGLNGLDGRGRMISGADDLEAGVTDNREDFERVTNIPERLVTLLRAELESEDDDVESEASLVEERACLIREVATLLSCVASHPVQSGVVLGFLSSNPKIARITLSVTNDLVNRKSLLVSGSNRKHAGLSNSETAELCRNLRRRVLGAISSASEELS
ncbi:hypothetical protein R1flu_003827 [Riccia fluitans]|uniref:Uncharacterized protein n=1 Tax=Riccia fluitans TaxID=41844 RepID=A0ABD1YA42_9MARC